MRKKILLTLTVLALASVTVLAANRERVVVSKDGRTTIATKRTPSVTRTEPNDPSLVTIYDNIATAYPKGSYWCCEGYTIMGPANLLGFPEYWQAGAFTPSANHTVTKVEVAVGFVGTTDLSLASIMTPAAYRAKPLRLGLCRVCPPSEAAARSRRGRIRLGFRSPLHRILDRSEDQREEYATWAVFNVNDTDQVDPQVTAVYCSGLCSPNNKWVASHTTPGPAFAVLGK